MSRYGLRDLIKDYEKYSDDSLKCDICRATYLMVNKNNFEYKEINEADIANLRTFLKCDILAKLEYLARINGATLPDWFRKYDGLKCPIEENDSYIAFLNGDTDKDGIIKRLFEKDLESALDIYKKRGLPWKEWDYTV